MEKAITKLVVPNTQCQDFLLAGVLNEINPELIKLLQQDKIVPKPLLVCSGGTSSRCTAKGHWTLDLRDKYKSIIYNPNKNEVEIGAGINMQSLINLLTDKNKSFPIGLSGNTGVGYILSGGISPLSRKYGLAVDNLVEIKGVWGNGEKFKLSKPNSTATETEEIEWKAICGAASFLAIITSLKLRVQEKKSILIWEQILNPYNLAEVIMSAEVWPNYGSLYWSWEDKIKVFGVFEIESESTLDEINLIIKSLPNSSNCKTYIIESLGLLPPIKSKNEINQESKKYSEVVGLLGKGWGNHSHKIINKLEKLMHQRPDKNCSISSQQLGGHTALIPKNATSFIHRESVWKPWITATWPPGDINSKVKSLKWLKDVWESLEEVCPGVHLAQTHPHLPWHRKEMDAAFGNWIKKLKELKSSCDPKGILPPL